MRTFATPTRKRSGARAPAPRRRAVVSCPHGSTVQRSEIRHILHGPCLQPQGGTAPECLQKTTLQGEAGMCFADEDRALREGGVTPLPETETPGGRVVPGTAGPHQNCAGMSLCGRQEYINWPYLGLEASDGVRRPPNITASWDDAVYFLPTGCKQVSCGGVSVNATRCEPTEREVIVFLYRWPRGTMETPEGDTIVIYQSDFHMIGRTPSSLPMAWESKMDRRERVVDIRDPWQSLYDAYPHTRRADRVIRQRCFCCDCEEVETR